MPFYLRATLQALAHSKLQDALLLFQNRRFSNAYYLGGYAVELGLKACISKRFSRDTFPDKKFVNDIYTHRLTELVRLAGLHARMITDQNGDPAFAANWGIVSTWNEDVRYESKDEFAVRSFMAALADHLHGVFPWVTRYW